MDCANGRLKTAGSMPELIKRCRVCGNPTLKPCGSLGSQFLSSIFPTTLDYRESVPCLPLDLVLCDKTSDPSMCGLLQLAHHIDLSAMYDAYPYTSATNSSMPGILKDVADSARRLAHLSPGDLILDIGCNDGTLLSFFKNEGFTLLGIDPAKNIKSVLTPDEFTHIRDFFSARAFASASPKKAKLIVSLAMFYHLSDPVGFSQDVASCLDEDGVWIIQMAYLPTMLKTNMYDNIVHEHCGYYGVQHMRWIMEKIGLEIFDVELNDVYGGSFRLFIKKKACRRFAVSPLCRALLQEELDLGIFEPATYQAFMRRIEKTREDLRALCRKINQEGKTIWVYGASTKGNTILQYCGLGRQELIAAADANPFKLGKFVVGADIPIKDEQTMRAAKPDYLLALPYSFVSAFRRREADLVAGGTKFIVPLPEVRVL